MGGPGRGCYAGQPLAFRCAECRKTTNPYWNEPARGQNVRMTGRSRAQRVRGANHHRWPDRAYEYECRDCGHVGWSRHPEAQRQYRREHGEVGA